MPAYTSLSLSQAQQIFDAFRPPSPSSSSRRFIVESIKELLGGLSNSNYKITVRDTRAAANNAGSKPVLRTYLLKVCEEKNDVELRAQVRALGLIRAISMDNRIPLAHPQFDRPCRISYPYRVGLSAEADSDSEEEEQNASAHASHDASAASKLPGDEYLLHLPSISPRALIFYEYLDGQMLRPSSSSIPAAFREVARAQAQLHSIPLQLPGRSFEFLECVPFGMFAVSKQYATQVIDSPSGAAQWGSHPFIQFLQPYLPVLAAALEVAPSLPQSVIHSDLFLENMIFEADQPATKEVATAPASSSSSAAAAPPRLRGLIDFEEMGVGPRLLDLTMTVVGCCYRSDDSLDLEAASVLVRSYDEFAMLTPQERHNFVAYLEWSLLAIAYWRWQNFNGQAQPHAHDEGVERRRATAEGWLECSLCVVTHCSLVCAVCFLRVSGSSRGQQSQGCLSTDATTSAGTAECKPASEHTTHAGGVKHTLHVFCLPIQSHSTVSIIRLAVVIGDTFSMQLQAQVKRSR